MLDSMIKTEIYSDYMQVGYYCSACVREVKLTNSIHVD